MNKPNYLYLHLYSKNERTLSCVIIVQIALITLLCNIQPPSHRDW